MDIQILSEKLSLLSQFLYEIRDTAIQSDRMRFRRNLERFGEITAYEISKRLNYNECFAMTPFGKSKAFTLAEQPIIAAILRAGLPLHRGLLSYFDKADNAFISAYRKHDKSDKFKIKIEYLSSPSIKDKTLILCDPMLATGQSMVLGYKALLKKGVPRETHIVSIIGSKEGVDFAANHLPKNTTLWIGAVDKSLNAKKYILPGLGDAGDLAYGYKE